MEPAWLTIARREAGVTQCGEGESNPRIETYHATVNDKRWDDKVPWCSSFLNWVLLEAGIEGTNSALARSWLEWGVELAEPRIGCVAVLTREEPDGWRGHAGLFLRIEQGKIHLWGGNQLGEVREHCYDVATVLSYRWPATASPPPD